MRPASGDAAAPGPAVWPDALAFVGGLGLAWHQGWKTTDLIWRLWLSSFVVGYATILWHVVGPVVSATPEIWRERGYLAAARWRAVAALVAVLAGGLFLLAFFTVHFGGFHLVHSVFINSFYPLTPEMGFPGWTTYAEVWSRYWLWLPLALVAERGGFARRVKTASPATAVTPEAIARRTFQPQTSGMTEPYKNVVRMHLLIFFFAGAHFLKLENFAVYAVVYAVYFFPWRWVFRRRAAPM